MAHGSAGAIGCGRGLRLTRGSRWSSHMSRHVLAAYHLKAVTGVALFLRPTRQ